METPCKARFDYPFSPTGLPDYYAHKGQVVLVLRPLRDGDEYHGPESELEPMYKIQSTVDGWIGDAWESELIPLA